MTAAGPEAVDAVGSGTMHRPSMARIAVTAGLLSILAACGGGSGDAGWTYAPIPTGTPPPSGSPGASPSGSPGASPSGSPATSPNGSPGASPSGSPAHSMPASPGASPSGSPGASPAVIELTETGTLQIVQDGQVVPSLTVQNGATYTFRITNDGTLPHNFFIGPAERLAASDVEGLPGVPPDGGDIPSFTEGTQEFQYTVTDETASLEFACTIPGHYPTMHGTFVVE
jgi:uncharacterized cupredoxin-like copper-binding protein